MLKFLIIHGPNLNWLGRREPHLYGRKSLEEVNEKILAEASALHVEIRIVQSNSEGEILDLLYRSSSEVHGIIINPAAFGSTSLALRDAILGIGLPVIEVHLTNIFSREKFRRSLISDVVCGMITGFQEQSYLLAIKALKDILKSGEKA